MARTRLAWGGLTAAVAVVATTLLLLLPGTSQADPPFRLPGQITDQAGVLSDGDVAAIKSSFDELSAEDNVNLFVVYVDTFTNPDAAQSWAADTAAASDLGANDVLLAVATGGRAYAVNVPQNFALSSSQLTSIAENDIRPQLANDDWAGAAIAAADGYRKALGSSSSAWWWAAAGIVVVGGGGYLLYRRSRRRKADAEAQPGSAQSGEPLEPLDQLSARSVQALIDTDNAVRASEFELTAAESEFGHEAVKEFRTAFESARESLTAAFEIRQRIDDEVPEDESTQRAMMAEILSRCADAAGKLDSESDRFDDLRDLRSRLPQVLAELPSSIDTQTARLPVAQATLDGLRQRYSPTALATVAANVVEATSRLAFARTRPARPATRPRGPRRSPPTPPRRRLPQTPGRDRGTCRRCRAGGRRPGADPARRRRAHRYRPERAVGQRRGLHRGRSGTRDGPRSAGCRRGRARGDLTARLDQIQAVLGVARSPQGAADPLTALGKVTEAAEALDTILAATRDAQHPAQRAQAGFGQALSTARAEVARPTTSSPPGVGRSEARRVLGWRRRSVIWPRPSRWGMPTMPAGCPRAAGRLIRTGGLASRPAGCRRLGWRRRSTRWRRGLDGAVLGGIMI